MSKVRLQRENDDAVLITGVAGFIGSHLTDKLLNLGMKVRGTDIVPLTQAQNLEKAACHPNFIYIKGDLRNSEHISEFLSGGKTIFHLLSVVGVTHYMMIHSN